MKVGIGVHSTRWTNAHEIVEGLNSVSLNTAESVIGTTAVFEMEPHQFGLALEELMDKYEWLTLYKHDGVISIDVNGEP